MKVSKAESARHRAVLLDAATRLFRERGFDKVSVAEITASAGLTHGAFYTHFDSKEALCSEALETAMRDSREQHLRLPDAVARIVRYLSDRHVRDRAGGCPIAALGVDVGRETFEVRSAFTRALASNLQAHAAARSELGARARDVVIASLATQVGALVMARAVTDTSLRDEILAAAKGSLLGS